MNVNIRQALLDIAQTIGRELRDPEPLSYPHALEVLGNVEDQLAALAAVVEFCTCPKVAESSSGLSGRPEGFLPTRHPKALANTLAGLAASVHPALRPSSQSDDFIEEA